LLQDMRRNPVPIHHLLIWVLIDGMVILSHMVTL